MQERVLLDAAPVAAEQRVRADEVDRAGDVAAVALGHHQQDLVAHLLADDRIERAREIGPAPFARAGLHVELEERVPHAFGEVRAGQPVDGDAVRQRVLALAADGLALARGERGQEGVEACRSRRSPSGTAGGCAGGSRATPSIRHSASVRKVTCTEDAFERLQMSASESASALRTASACSPGPHQKAAPVRRRERHRHLQLRIVVAAGALIGLGPAVVEDVFALRMRFGVAGDGADDRAAVFGDEVHGLPAGAVADRAGQFQRRQKIMRNEWVIVGS